MRPKCPSTRSVLYLLRTQDVLLSSLKRRFSVRQGSVRQGSERRFSYQFSAIRQFRQVWSARQWASKENANALPFFPAKQARYLAKRRFETQDRRLFRDSAEQNEMPEPRFGPEFASFHRAHCVLSRSLGREDRPAFDATRNRSRPGTIPEHFRSCRRYPTHSLRNSELARSSRTDPGIPRPEVPFYRICRLSFLSDLRT